MDLNRLDNRYCFLIPARGGSKGIKNKNLKKIKNKSLIAHAIDFCKLFSNNKSIFVNTDNKKIIIESLRKNVNYIKRPKKLAGDRISDFKILNHTIKKISSSYKYIIYLQPTSPFRKKRDLIEAIKLIHKKNYDAVWSVSKIDKKFHPLKVLINKKDKLYLFSKRGEKVIARQMLNDSFIRNGIFYIFRVSSLIKYKTIYLNKCGFKVITSKHINIDTPEDLKNARRLAKTIKFI